MRVPGGTKTRRKKKEEMATPPRRDDEKGEENRWREKTERAKGKREFRWERAKGEGGKEEEDNRTTKASTSTNINNGMGG